MKHLLLAAVSVLFFVIPSLGQCPNSNPGTFCSPTNGSGLVLNTRVDVCDMAAGEYHDITNLVAGNTYRVGFCDPSSNNPPPTNYNSYLTVYGPNGLVGFNDDFCGTNAQLEFVAPASGTYRILCNVSGNCNASNFTFTPASITLIGTAGASSTVSSINRASPNPTNASSVNYTVTFSGSVAGLTSGNFSLTTTGGISGASVGTPTGSGTTWTVPVNTGSGDGTIRLDLVNATGLSPSVTVPYTSGQIYDIDKTGPGVVIGAPSTTAVSCGSVTYTVTYTDAAGISLSNGNISLTTTGTASANVNVSGSGTSVRTVTLTNFVGTGTVSISIAANTATDAAGNNAAATGPGNPITVSPPPSASINYSGSPYCNSGTAAVTLTGITGGSFSSATGLSLNAVTGEVNSAASTPGTYTVTYIIAANGGCPQFQTTASITINASPSATINFVGSPYCNSGTAAVTLTGSTGGSFSSAAGLSLNTATGEVNLTASTTGTYTVTYIIAASGGCAQVQATANVIIYPLPNILVNTNSLCQNSTLTVLPSAGGTWISNTPTVASITNTGLITGITPGTVNFTFTETATGCSNITMNITVKPTPSVSLTADKEDVCPNTEVTLSATCSLPTATVNWITGAPTVIPDAAAIPYTYKASCTFDGCTGHESSVEVRTHRILVAMKSLEPGTPPQPIARSVIDNMAPTNQIQAPISPRHWTFIAKGCHPSESAVFKLSGPISLTTIDNNPPYALFANVGETYFSVEHPNYGTGGSFPNGSYTLTVDLRNADGAGGPFPKNRVATGSLSATRTLHFTIATTGLRTGTAEEATPSEETWVAIYPNPVQDKIAIQLMGTIGETVQLSLINGQGQLFKQKNFQLTETKEVEMMNIAAFPAGLYLLKITKGEKVKTLKVFKVN
ncbi:MAG: T9SS type A sorting domain-containing protein [Spirosomataceae bacterium]